jgi:biopolymer transport protein ExbD
MIDSFPVTLSGKKARIEIIPLIDVVFFLLATFVIFMLSLQHLGSLEASLPRSGDPSSVDSGLYVRADAKNLFSFHEGRGGAERTVGPAELKNILGEFKARVSPARVMVAGGRGASFGAMVDLLDLIRGEGIREVAVETIP